jgi:hypothetical protein
MGTIVRSAAHNIKHPALLLLPCVPARRAHHVTPRRRCARRRGGGASAAAHAAVCAKGAAALRRICARSGAAAAPGGRHRRQVLRVQRGCGASAAGGCAAAARALVLAQRARRDRKSVPHLPALAPPDAPACVCRALRRRVSCAMCWSRCVAGAAERASRRRTHRCASRKPTLTARLSPPGRVSVLPVRRRSRATRSTCAAGWTARACVTARSSTSGALAARAAHARRTAGPRRTLSPSTCMRSTHAARCASFCTSSRRVLHAALLPLRRLQAERAAHH